MGTTLEDYYNGYPWWTSSYFKGSLSDFGALGHQRVQCWQVGKYLHMHRLDSIIAVLL